MLIVGEDPDELKVLQNEYVEYLDPRPGPETTLVDELVKAAWRIARLDRAQTALDRLAVARYLEEGPPPPPPPRGLGRRSPGAPALGREVVRSMMRGVKRYADKKMERFLSPAELARLGDALTAADDAGESPSAIAAIRLLTLTGCRREEILSLRWDYIDKGRSRT